MSRMRLLELIIALLLFRSSDTTVRLIRLTRLGKLMYDRIARYQDGKDIERYAGDRSYESLSNFIDTQSKRYIRSLGDVSSDSTGQSVMSSVSGINSEGIAEEVNQTRFEELKSAGPVFVKFYAPW
jgi:hypothetical protein